MLLDHRVQLGGVEIEGLRARVARVDMTGQQGSKPLLAGVVNGERPI